MMTKRPLSTELLLETAGGDKANIRNLPAPIMQALYFQLTGKREKYQKNYNSDYLIDKESIRDLVIKLEQTLEQFNVQGSSLSATILHFNKDKQDCSSLEKFSQYDASRTDPVSAISLRFDFLLTPPSVSDPQNYTITININSFILLKSDSYASSGLGKYRNNKNVIDLSIEYVDYVVSRSFQVTIEEWVESLPKNNIYRVPKWIISIRFNLLESFKSATSISIVYAYYVYFFGETVSTYSVFSTIALFYIVGIFVESILEAADGMVFPFAHFPFIIMNKGDERNLQKFKEKRTRVRTHNQ